MRVPPPPARESRLRRDVLRILGAALAAVDPEHIVRERIGPGGVDRPDLEALLGVLAGRESEGRRLRLVSVGKAAVPMARGALSVIPRGCAVEGIVLAPYGGAASPPDFPAGIRYREGGHPLPSESGVGATGEILRLVERGGPADPILVLLSGGGSALLAHPAPGISLEELRVTTDLLLRAGASIPEVNTVRKHVEMAKGGRLARACGPSPVLGLVISDVIGNALDVIASGPLSPDPTSFADALEVLEGRGVLQRVPAGVIDHLRNEQATSGGESETPTPGDPAFERIRLRVIADIETAATPAAAAARDCGYRTHLLPFRIAGEARDAGRRLAALAQSIRAARRGRSPQGGAREGAASVPPICIVTGGETTVTVVGSGTGGRNQEVALAAALELAGEEGTLVASMGTDGVDGPTAAAGALATASTLERGSKAGLDAKSSLSRNDSHTYFHALGDLILTGPTGTNVMDLQLILIR